MIIPKKKQGSLKVVSVSLPEPFIDMADELIENGYISSRAEIVRTCVNEWLINRKLMKDNGDIGGFHDFVVELKRSASNVWMG